MLMLVALEHLAALQISVSQSVLLAHLRLTAQGLQSGPPQSRSVSLSFCWLSSQCAGLLVVPPEPAVPPPPEPAVLPPVPAVPPPVPAVPAVPSSMRSSERPLSRLQPPHARAASSAAA